MMPELGPAERDKLRRQVVAFWARRVSHKEIAARLSITVDELKMRYATELRQGPAKWTADQILHAARAAKDGDIEMAMLLLMLVEFDKPAVIAILAPGPSVH